MYSKVPAIMLLLLITSLLGMPNIALGKDLDAVIAEYAERVQQLEAKHVDTHSVVEKINEAVMAYEQGDYARASSILGEADSLLMELEKSSQQAYIFYTISKALSVAVLALTPLLVYIILPRAYVYLWFKTRRKWIVREY